MVYIILMGIVGVSSEFDVNFCENGYLCPNMVKESPLRIECGKIIKWFQSPDRAVADPKVLILFVE